MDTTFSIQQVSELTGLSLDTLRYYERIGLLDKVDRATSGHRRYSQRDLDWLGLLIDLRETGMPLARMLHFAELRRQGDATAAERLLLLEQHQRSLQEQMRKLEQHMQALHAKIAHKRAFLAQHEAASSAADQARKSTAEHEIFVSETQTPLAEKEAEKEQKKHDDD